MFITKRCPIETALNYIGKKWALNIIRDLFIGKKRFMEILHSNEGLTTRMLALRLKELEDDGFIYKNIDPETNKVIDYELTIKGFDLNKILYELNMFAVRQFSEEVFLDPCEIKYDRFDEVSKKGFKIEKNS